MSFIAGSRLHGGALHHRRQCSNQSSVGRRVVIVRSFRERGAPSTHRHHGPFFFCCIAELAIKPCRSSRSKLRGEFGIPKHLTSSPRARTCQSPHPHLACHCGRSRLATNIPNSLPSHLYTQPSVIPLSHSFFFGSVLLGFFFALCYLGKIPGGAPFSQLLKSGNGSRVDRP